MLEVSTPQAPASELARDDHSPRAWRRLMKNKLLTASAVLFVAFLAGQVTRFVGNVVLANLLSPGAFGVVAVVNLMILALNLLSDVGLRQIVIQRQGEITASFTNTVWALQVARGFLIWSVAILCGLVLRLLQLYGWIGVSASYSDPLLPFLIAAAGSAALFQGFESTKALTERRALALGRVTAIGLIAQVFAMVLMITVAKLSPSPWALVIGGVASAGLQCVLTHLWLPGSNNRWAFDKRIAFEVLHKGKWLFVSSFVTFLGGNADILILGGLTDAAALGNYVVAFQLVNVMQVLAAMISSNVVMPAFSAANRDESKPMGSQYRNVQIVSDAVIVTAAGILAVAGPAIVRLLFDHRYTSAGTVLSCFAIGVVGMRYYVVEQLMNADGNFKLTSLLAIVKLICLAAGTYLGFHLGGLTGAAVAVGISTFAGWPVYIGYLRKTIGIQWRAEALVPVFLLAGAGMGLLASKIISLYR